MKKSFKILCSFLCVGNMFLSSANAFFLGSDKFSPEEYKEADIVFEHHSIFPDEYAFKGERISQSMAEKLTYLYQIAFQSEDDGDVQLHKTYIIVAKTLIEFLKKMDKEINKLNSKNASLYLKNSTLSLENSQLKDELENLKKKNRKN